MLLQKLKFSTHNVAKTLIYKLSQGGVVNAEVGISYISDHILPNGHLTEWNVTPRIFEGRGRYFFAAFFFSLL